jgi:hypothetical protein
MEDWDLIGSRGGMGLEGVELEVVAVREEGWALRRRGLGLARGAGAAGGEEMIRGEEWVIWAEGGWT